VTAVDEPAERDQQRWSLDEYVVVADLYLRRGRSSGSNDPEVVDLAHMTGRSPAAISRRLGNYRGTEQPGVGLKPVVGEAAEMFWTMKHDDQFRRRVVEEARGRLAARSASMTSLSPPVVAQFVDPEESTVEVGEVVTPATTREMVRAEAQLVRRYREWLDPDRVRLRGIVIDAPATRLRADLYDPWTDYLIEAKAAPSRENLRYAIGQLFDYRRYLKRRAHLAVLVPQQPDEDLMGLLDEADVASIWPSESRFVDSVDGRCIEAPTGPPA
jgi:hypothetical protein